MKHSSTPWRIERETSNIIAGTDNKEIRVLTVNGAVDDKKIDIANAAFIVRAVNAHQELVDALKASATMTNELLRTIDEGHWYSDDLVALRVRVLQAIAKAEGK